MPRMPLQVMFAFYKTPDWKREEKNGIFIFICVFRITKRDEAYLTPIITHFLQRKGELKVYGMPIDIFLSFISIKLNRILGRNLKEHNIHILLFV